MSGGGGEWQHERFGMGVAAKGVNCGVVEVCCSEVVWTYGEN